ncbi:hypothetical protein LG634_24910 [Streptomyces bambusae]|uniref:DUF6197 family protein n=1 Tax=Streptomyces bambusae TaxID=1550616 RepID=UPI001CFCE7DD|nr:hypothetical protein [Streptomyces bambusae]MCB5168055.1 hypothetical protein [Streptomyces bambusae]
MNHQTSPTDTPRGDRRTVRVILPARPADPVPATVEDVLLGAARVIARLGLYHDDYVQGALSLGDLETPLFVRPMSVVGALRFVTTGSPQRTCQLADQAMCYLALSIDGGPYRQDLLSMEAHVEDWADSVDAPAAVAFLELAATAPERAA